MTDGAEILSCVPRPGHDYKIKLYDFKRPDKFSKEHIRTYRIMNETIGRTMEPILSSLLGQSASVELSSVDQLAFHELFEAAAEAESYAILNMRPLRGPALMQIATNTANALVHRSCGGQGRSSMPARALTDIESLVLQDVLESLTHAINEGWSNMIDLDCHVTAIESDPRHAMIVPPAEMIILAVFKMTAGDTPWYFTIVVPYITIEPLVSKLSARWLYNAARRPSASPPLGSRVSDLRVHAEVSIDIGNIQLRDLPRYAAGEPLPIPADAPLVFSVGNADVAQFELPSSYAEVPNELKIDECESGESSEALLGSLRNDSAKPVHKALQSAISDLQVDIRGIRDAVNELAEDRRAIESESTAVEEENRFASSQINDVTVALSNETAQMVAFVLSPLDPTFSAGVLAALPDSRQAEVVRCLTSLGPANRMLHRRIVSYIARNAALALRRTVSGGYEATVRILNHVPRAVEKRVMDKFKDEEPALFEEIAKRMFVFEDFVLVDAIAIQKLATRVAPEEFAMALKSTLDQVREHILSALDPDFSTSVKVVASKLGPVRLRDVETSQREIIEELRLLEQAGEVIVARPGDLVE